MAADLDLPSLKRMSKPANQNRTLDTRFVGPLSPAMSWSKETTIFIFLLATLSIAALNGFFDSYRIAFFKAESYDDYARYLIWLLGEPGGALPKSPFVYRIGSVVFAAPFYYLPLIDLQGGGAAKVLPPATLEYAKATQAMCAANAFAVLMSCVAAYLYCRTRLKVTPEWSFIGSVLLFVLSRFLGLVAADGIALLPMTLIVLAIFEKRFLVFVAMVLLGVLVNEKTAIVATLFVAGRLIFSEGNRSFYLGSLLVALATVAGVFAVASVLQFPGAEYQRDPSTYLSSALNMLKDLFTPKGVYRNLLLPASLIGLWLIALCAPHRRRVVQPADLGVILGMVAICCAVDVKYNIGRISAYAAPMFVIGAAQALSWMLSERVPVREARQPNHSAL